MQSGAPKPMLDARPGLPAPARADWLTYGDAMRVLGILAVLVVHACDMVLFSDQVGRPHWWAANVLDAAGRWAVPVFIMLSGALLLHPSRPQTPGEFYRRRLARLGIAIAFWSVAFMLFALYYTRWAAPTWADQGWQKSIWQQLLKGAPYVHLHFVFRLGGLYLLTPLLRVYVRHAPLRLRATMVALLLGLSMADSAVVTMLHLEYSAFSMLWPFLGFYLAGDVLRQVRVTPPLAAWSCVGYAVCVAGMAGGTGLLLTPGVRPVPFPSVDMMLYDFLNPLRVVMSFCAWFILAHVFGRMGPASRVQRAMKVLAPLTLGVYLVHPLFREVLWVQQWLWYRADSWIGLPLAFAVILAGSWALTYGLSRVPYVRRIVG